MSLILSAIVQALWTFAARRPYVAASVATVLAIGVSAVWWTGGDTMAERGAPAGPVIAFVLAAALVAAGSYVSNLEAARTRMAQRSSIVPPPPFATKPYFWVGFVTAAVMVPVSLGILGSLSVEDGRTVAEATIVDTVFAPNEFGKPFYDIVVDFTTADGQQVFGETSKYGSARIGESLTIQYLDDAPTDIRKYDVKNQLGLLAMFGGMAIIGSMVAVINRPRRILRDIPAPVIPGTQQWSQKTDNGQPGVAQELRFFVGDTSKIWVWLVGERTIAGLTDWIDSGGAPQSGTQAHWTFDVHDIREVTLHANKVDITMSATSAQKTKTFEVGDGGGELLAKLAWSLGWAITESVAPASNGLFGGLFGKKASGTLLAARPAHLGAPLA